MGRGDSPDEPREIRSAASPVPPVHARTWRHPSELAAGLGRHHHRHPLAGSEPSRGPRRRFSTTALLMAAAVGAVAMFGVLSAFQLVSPNGATAADDEIAVASDLAGTVTLRVEREGSVRVGAGLVLDDGAVATTLDLGNQPEAARVAIGGRDDTWVRLDWVATDTETGVSVLRGVEATPFRSRDIVPPGLGDPVRLGSASTGGSAVAVRPQTQRLVSTTAQVTVDGVERNNLLTVTTAAFGAPADLVLDDRGHRVVGLIVEADDDPSDRLVYALPVGRVLEVADRLATGALHPSE